MRNRGITARRGAGKARRRIDSPSFQCLLVGLLTVASACGDDAGGQDGGRRDAGGSGDGGTAVPPDPIDAAADAAADAGERDGGRDPFPIVGSDYVDFGELRPGPGGVIQLELDVPDDALSLVLTADPGAEPRDVALLELRAPSGELLFDATGEGSQPFDPASAQNGAEQLPYSWMLPSSPQLALEPGRYRVALFVGGARREPVRVDAVLARGRAVEPPRPLALVFWLVAGAALDAERAAADPQLNRALAVAAELYAPAGIELAAPSFRDLAVPAELELARLDGDDELAQLLALLGEQAGPERALDVLLVDELAPEPGKTVLAKVSGVPAAPAHPALGRRGAVVLPLATLPDDAQRAGALLAHECAHYLGLRHTSEYDGLRHDPIADTPECPQARASHFSAAGEPLLSAEDCADLDGDNLLFYTPPQSAVVQDTLTLGQAWVLLHNPLLR
jgi:hypothetical protein